MNLHNLYNLIIKNNINLDKFYAKITIIAEEKCMKKYLQYQENIRQISSTGARALIVLVALLMSPKTYEEIKTFLIDCGLANSQYSIDTVRMDLNTLKAIGCEISKAVKSNNYKYSIIKHPFNVNITPLEVFFLKEAYKSISKTCSPETLLNYHNLFEKLANISDSEEVKETILGISLLKGLNIDLVKDLVTDEKHHNKIKIIYEVRSNKEITYDITLEKLGLRSDKLYAFCYNHTLGKRTFLRVAKIRQILCKFFDKNSKFGLDTFVKFKLTQSYLYQLESNETIVETKPDFVIIEGRYYNDFIAMQRILSFGQDCTVLEPENIKELVITKLLEMREVYGKSKKI